MANAVLNENEGKDLNEMQRVPFRAETSSQIKTSPAL